MRKQRQRDAVWKFLTYSFVIVMTLGMMVPLYWMMVAATLPQEEFLQFPPRLYPGTAFFDNLAVLHEETDFLISIWNSVFIAVVYTVLSVLLCSMAGFAFAKYEFRFKEPIFYTILATLILPIQLLVIPLFLMMSQIGWTDTFRAIIIPWLANPIGIFLMRQNMKSIPDALLESARMDGATEFQIFYRIALPAMRSSVAALAIILFLFQWDLFLYPLVILEDSANYTIPVALSGLEESRRVNFDQIMVASSLAIIPMAILFLILQKQFVSGILAGSLKE
ncbi:carbohydrate ABC transporter permease [Halorubrum vacuolatum]|uniref:Carbohydrate ABC transporter membrane protein 2, CUT1 family n=1 Tax=Halorubrum vacuolatum TaxID=63740 RepID=A0A238XLT8_HALVU|nr:carbohydrate ABC transporter permease [Halorubrum vacuolatum]SNR59986.1 carbohydrate ABC transporter membrane protein 2, CUT1 family [Halorubrum vacuolatum]